MMICSRDDRSAGYHSAASYQTSATAGTTAVRVTRFASIAVKASSKAALRHITTVPPPSRVPISPGWASGRSWEVDSTAMYTVSGPTRQRRAAALAL